MTYPDFVACVRALRAKNGAPDASDAPSEEAWFEALLEYEGTAH